jgi:hypothetical protein
MATVLFYSPLENAGSGSSMEQQLWEYIDGTLSAEHKKRVEALLAANSAWQQQYKELLEVNQLFESAELEQPSLRFSKNVMEEIGRLHVAPATRNYINTKIIWGIGGFLILSLLVFVIYGVSQVDWSAKGEHPLPVDFSKIKISNFFNNTWINGFMMINIVLALMLLDNYLGRKRKAFRKRMDY